MPQSPTDELMDVDSPLQTNLASENAALKLEITELKKEIEILKAKLKQSEQSDSAQAPLPTVSKKLTHVTKKRVPRPGQVDESSEAKDVVMETSPFSPEPFPERKAEVQEPRKSESKPVGGINIFGGFDPTKTRLRSSTTGGSRPIIVGSQIPAPMSTAPVMKRRLSSAVKETVPEIDQEKILGWIKGKVAEDADKETLKDGVVLCKLMNAITGAETLKPKTGKSLFVYKVSYI